MLYRRFVYKRTGNSPADKQDQINLILGGGGVKGIAYSGMLRAAEEMRYGTASMAGVSAGAIASAFISAGYNSSQLLERLSEFDLGKIDLSVLDRKVPVISRYKDYAAYERMRGNRTSGIPLYDMFIRTPLPVSLSRSVESDTDARFAPVITSYENTPAGLNQTQRGFIGGILKSIVTYAKEGAIYDGDYAEEWFYKTLAAKGCRTFADLRGGIADASNPRGYKARMTAVDCNRAKVLILPDDIEFYGIDPDSFEIARAIRMSTCIPFVFNAVRIGRKENGVTRMYSIVDGGVLDQFPYWAIGNRYENIGFQLNGGNEGKVFTMDNALVILKGLVTAVHNIGVPKDMGNKVKYSGAIDVSKVGTLDFHIDEEDKRYLFAAGYEKAKSVLEEYGSAIKHVT